jgi:hypothetical protein
MKAQKRRRETAVLLLYPRPCPGHFAPPPPAKDTRYAMYRRLVCLGGRSGRMQKFLPPLGYDLLTVQHLASPCTDYAIQVFQREVPPSYSEQTKCSGLKKEAAVAFQCRGTLVPNHTTLESSPDCRGECEISDIHLDSLLGRGLLPIGSCCGFCR